MNQDKLGGLKERIILHRLLGASAGALAVFLFGFMLIPTLISEAHATEDVSAAVSWRNITLTLDPGYNPSTGASGSGDIDFGEVIPSSADTSTPGSENYGTQKVVKKTINVTTEGNYYTVYLSVLGTNNSLGVSGDTIREIPAITPASGNTATTFSATSWGYSVPYIAGKSSDAFPAPAVLSAYDTFLASSSDVTANNLTKFGTGSSVYNTGTWAPVPTTANTEQIYKNSTNAVAGFDSGDNFDIYYSIMVDTDTMAGIYENQVVYTAFASTNSIDIVSQNVSRSEAKVTSGTVELLQVDLASTITLTTGKVKVYLVPHSVVVANDYNPESLTTTDYPNCPVTAVSNNMTITCTMPAFNAKGSTDSTGIYKVQDGSAYDFWVRITAPDGEILNYISHYKEGNTDVASAIYGVGLQSVDTESARLVISMQQMSPSICDMTPEYETASENFVLTDSREGVYYDVRKVDGRCWMASNLRFASHSLDPASTDIDVAKTITWADSTTGGSYDEGRMHSGTDYNGAATAWYNLALASALTHTGSNNKSKVEHSICPKNWTLPTVAEWQSVLQNRRRATLNMVSGSYYKHDGTSEGPGSAYAFWWSNQIDQSNPPYGLNINGNYDSVTSFYGKTKNWSFYIRCIARN